MNDETTVPLPEWQTDETGTPYREWHFEAPYLEGHFVTVQESFNNAVRLRFGPFFVLRLSDGGIGVEDSRKDPGDEDASTYFPSHRAAALVAMSQYPACSDLTEPEQAAVLFAAAELLIKGAGQLKLQGSLHSAEA
jgi:hypothetical protein